MSFYSSSYAVDIKMIDVKARFYIDVWDIEEMNDVWWRKRGRESVSFNDDDDDDEDYLRSMDELFDDDDDDDDRGWEV